jgi:hypothetical protein
MENLSQMFRVNEGSPQQPLILAVQFFERPVQHKAKSLKEGRPIFYTSIMCRITAPGMKNQVVDEEIELIDDEKTTIRRKMWMNDQNGNPIYYTDRFAEAYGKWRAGMAQVDGTPLETYSRLDATQVAMLKYLEIHSLEALAGLNDSSLQQLGPGGRQMRDEAKNYLEAARGNAPIAQLTSQLEAMQEQMQELQRRNELLSAIQPAGREKRKYTRKESAAA